VLIAIHEDYMSTIPAHKQPKSAKASNDAEAGTGALALGDKDKVTLLSLLTHESPAVNFATVMQLRPEQTEALIHLCQARGDDSLRLDAMVEGIVLYAQAGGRVPQDAAGDFQSLSAALLEYLARVRKTAKWHEFDDALATIFYWLDKTGAKQLARHAPTFMSDFSRAWETVFGGIKYVFRD
jgi:hypothetical protein